MNRRLFINRILGSTSIETKIHSSTRKNESTQYDHISFLAESGIVGVSDVTAIGIISLSPTKANQLSSYITQLRDDHSFRNRVSYKSNNRRKESFAIDLIGTFISHPGLAEVALKIHLIENTGTPEGYNLGAKLEARKLATGLLLSDLPGDTRVLMKAESYYGPSANYKAEMAEVISSPPDSTLDSFTATDVRDDEIIQLTDLLVGTVASEIRGGSKSPTKVAIST
ncbi:MAG: hypothetical protein AAFN93_28250 [Bacteroidota bacterium]